MTKTVAFACVAAAAFFASGFMLPQPLSATPGTAAAAGMGASLDALTAVPAMADLFPAEKAGAIQGELPAQF